MRDRSASLSGRLAVSSSAASQPAPGTTRRLHRIRKGVRHSHNWFQLVRFAVVGGTGYIVNLGTFAALVHPLHVNYLLAAVFAFFVAVTNNFLLNRHWTFRARDGHATYQAPRFFLVSVIALCLNLAVLELLVAGFGTPKVPAQAIAILCATPLNFIGNKLWTFTGRGRGQVGA